MSDWVTMLTQDSRGYLWIGTSEGLSRFDGISFVNLTSKEGLADNFVECIAEVKSRPGTMLVGTRTGLALVNSRTMQARMILLPKTPLEVSHIVCDRHGTTWLATGDGLYTLDDSSAHKFDSAVIEDVAEGADGTLFITNGQEVSILAPDRASVRRVPLGLRPGARASRCRVSEDGSILVCSDDSMIVHLRDSVILERITTQDYISDALAGGDGTILASGVRGLFHIPLKLTNQASLVFPHQLDFLMRDRERNLWGTSRDGLYMLSSHSMVSFSDTLGWDIGITQPSRWVDARQHLWCITRGGFFEFVRGESGLWQRTFHETPQFQPRWATIDSDNRLWASSIDKHSLFCYEVSGNLAGPSTLRRVNELKLNSSPHYFSARDRREMWIAFADTPTVVRLDRRNGKVISAYNPPSPQFGPRCSLIDGNNVFWIGEFDDGLFYTSVDSPNSWRTLTVRDGLPDNCIRSLCTDTEGSLWIGTRYGGAAKYHNGSVQRFDIKDGLPGDWVHSLYQDSSGRVWFCTSLGLAYLQNSSTKEFHAITELQGQRVLELGELRKNSFWIRTSAAMMFYEFNTEGEAPPTINISGMEMSGTVVDPDSELEFVHDQNLLSIVYSGICFEDSRRLRYTYRLEGFDRNWQGPTDMRSIKYNGLKPGKYTFSVKAITGNGTQSSRAAAVRFSIAPALWERWWFRSIAGLFLLSIGPVVYYRRVNSLRREMKVKEDFSRQLIESQESERKRIAASLHDSLGQNLILSKNYAMMGLKSAKEPSSIEQLTEISALLSQSLDDVRAIAYDLRPYHLDRLGLTRTLEFVIDRVKNSTAIACSADIDPVDHCLSPEGELSLYRVVQESLNNVLKHSKATAMRFTLQKSDHQIRCEIHDNGIGFDKQAIAKRADGNDGFGLHGMAERIRLLGGTMEIESQPRQGTALIFTIPQVKR